MHCHNAYKYPSNYTGHYNFGRSLVHELYTSLTRRPFVDCDRGKVESCLSHPPRKLGVLMMSDTNSITTDALTQLLQIFISNTANRKDYLILRNSLPLYGQPTAESIKDLQPILDVLVSLLPPAPGNGQTYTMALSLDPDTISLFISANKDQDLEGARMRATRIHRIWERMQTISEDAQVLSQQSLHSVFVPIFLIFSRMHFDIMISRFHKRSTQCDVFFAFAEEEIQKSGLDASVSSYLVEIVKPFYKASKSIFKTNTMPSDEVLASYGRPHLFWHVY